MNVKIIVMLFILLFITTFSFAAAPTVSDLILSNSYTNDLNYFSFPLDINAVAIGDVNADTLCYYKISTAGDAIAGNWDGDTNNCYVVGLTSAGFDDFNFSMIVQSASLDANGTSPVEYMWRDNNAPEISYGTTGSNFGTKYILTCTDLSSHTGNGSGCKSITYSTDGGDNNTTVNGSTVTLNLNSVGNYDIIYYTTDNLDNVRYYPALSTVRIEAYSSGVCNLANLITLVLIGALIVTILLAGFSLFNSGEISSTIVALVATAIFMIIMVIIIASFTGAICFTP